MHIQKEWDKMNQLKTPGINHLYVKEVKGDQGKGGVITEAQNRRIINKEQAQA